MKKFGVGGAIFLFVLSLCPFIYGLLNILGSFAPEPDPTASLPLGIAMVAVGILLQAGGAVILVAISRQNQKEESVTLKIDLPANTSLDKIQCEQCGAALTLDNIKMVAGSPIVSCPYCGATYEMIEEAKW